jgi:hypothetical protein
MTAGRVSDNPEDLIVPTIPEAELKKVVSDDAALERFLALQVSLNNDGVYFEPNCPLCSSMCRKDAEEKWIKDRNSDDIRDFLKSKGEPVPLTVIKNHMEYHIDQSYVELRKKEYIQKILTLSRINLNTLSRVEMALSSVGERLISVNAAEDPGESPAALEKARADSTCKLVASMAKLLELRATLMGEMQDSGNLLSVRQEDFEAIFKETLLEYKSPEAREIVKTILDKFSKVARKK